ncbi:RidA family protein [Burkholderia lata]|uniref:RidA family protein n=1 Tax=Burkholderia lata (strain ATCC 17760 / DSM 23089 / LMG 22485 / NCIMB 9086 / R18194 / 383) TaxID=482957 RepID=UPI0020C63CD1|nr:RidA family protein [Burkholderia lata]
MTNEAVVPFSFNLSTKTMIATTTDERLKSLGLVLPPIPSPIANFVNWRRSGQILYLSGQGPRDASGSVIKGKLGRNYSVDRGYADARQVGLQLLSTMQQAAGSLDHVAGVLKIFGMSNAEPDFCDHPNVINGCSDLLVEVLGDRGRHARSAVGMGSLPNGMSVEIEAIIEIVNGY